MHHEKPVIYLPGLPSLSSDDVALYNTAHAARIDLITHLAAKNYHVQDIDGHRPWLKTMLHQAEQSDAFIFPPMTSLPADHPRFHKEAAQRWFEFFSLITGVHVGSREKYGTSGLSKPCIVMDPDNQWSLAIDLLKDLHSKGMFSSEVDDIVQVVRGAPERPYDYHELNRQAVTSLSQVLEQGKGKPRREIHSKYPPEHDFKPFRSDIKRHHFGVLMFGSATTQEKEYLAPVHELSQMVGERGWRLVTGAGNDGCMGAADKGFEVGKRAFNLRYPKADYKPAHIGVSTQPILRLEGPPQYLDQLIITDDIYKRMEVMIKGQKSSDQLSRARDSVKVVYVAPGGTGTLHEFATLMQLANNGNMMDNRVVVLLNPRSHTKKSEGFWDPLIKTAKRLGFDSKFEVAETPEAAIAIADREYQKWLERNPDLKKSMPHPELNANPLPSQNGVRQIS